MSNELKGSCHCEKVKYLIIGNKQFDFLCHCLDCRVLNSGGHLSGAIYSESGLKVDGELTVYEYDGGKDKIQAYFCKECATTLYAKPLSHEGIIVLRANTLEEPSSFKPEKSLFPESAFEWDASVIK